jgi:hypothetical protein
MSQDLVDISSLLQDQHFNYADDKAPLHLALTVDIWLPAIINLYSPVIVLIHFDGIVNSISQLVADRLWLCLTTKLTLLTSTINRS